MWAFNWIFKYFFKRTFLYTSAASKGQAEPVWGKCLGASPGETQTSCLIRDVLWSVSQTILVWKNPTFSHISKTFSRRGNSMLNLSMRYKWALAEDVRTTNGVPFLIFCKSGKHTAYRPHLPYKYTCAWYILNQISFSWKASADKTPPHLPKWMELLDFWIFLEHPCRWSVHY